MKQAGGEGDAQDAARKGWRRFKCPLLVGFTGHRDLVPEEIPSLEAAADELLADIGRQHPHTPLVVMTGLAEGADRLAARVALRRGIEFIAVLPLPYALYVTDFETPESRREFDDLLAQAAGRIELPLPADTTLGAASTWGPGRDACYANLGTFLAERSHVLVAIWDGVDNRKPGGTASVVKARTEPTTRTASLAWRELLPNDVIHIRAGRISTAESAVPGSRVVLQPPRTREPQRTRLDDDEVTARIDAFNSDVDRLGSRLAAGFDESGRYLLAGPLPPPRAGTASSLRDHFAAFDRLAIHWQQAATRSLLRIHALIWVAVLCFELFTNFDAVLGPVLNGLGIDEIRGARFQELFRSEIFVVYFLFIGVAWAVGLWANRGRQQPRHLDYRSIAEALRIQFFWRLAGLDRMAAAEFLASQMSVLAWMRSAVATLTLMADARHPHERSAAPARTLRLVNRGLCLGQFRYFRKAALRDARELGRRQRWIAVLFLAGLAATIAHGLTGFVSYVALESVAAMLFVTAGLLASHTDTLALDEHINQYSGMAYLYAAARRAVVRALRAGDLDRARDVIADVGEEALGENASWVLLHRNRPLRVPQA